MTKANIENMINDIEYVLDEDQVAYINHDGTWELGLAGCQPSNTQAVGYDCIHNIARSELVENIESFFNESLRAAARVLK